MSNDTALNAARVAIFQASHLLQVHTLNIISSLAEAGHKVDVFLYDVDRRCVGENPSELAMPGVSVWNYEANKVNGTGRYTSEFVWKTWRNALTLNANKRCGFVASASGRLAGLAKYAALRLRWNALGGIKQMVDQSVLDKIREVARNVKYDCVIGIEPLGLALASFATKGTKPTMAYYSLEIEAARYWPHVSGRLLHKLEKQAHRRCQITVIQDSARWRFLKAYNRVRRNKPFFLPVSLRGNYRTHRSRLINEKLGIPSDKKIVLLFGLLERRRFADRLLETALELPDDWVMVMHGPSFGEEGVELAGKAKRTGGKVLWSNEILDYSQIEDFISGAHIGLVFYPDFDMNHLHTGRSSEKMALFTKCGVPIVSFDYPSFIEVVGEYHCGVTIKTLDHLTGALLEIDQNHCAFCSGARQAFEHIYRFDSYKHRLLNRLACD